MQALEGMRIAIPLAVAVLAIPAASADIAVTERGDHTTEATVTIDATPAEVYAVATDYANWRRVLSDIKSVRVVSGGRDRARVRFASKALQNTVTVELDNIPNRAIRFRGVEGPPGGRARGEYILDPIEGGTRTRVSARLYMNVVGVPGLFVFESQLRKMREAKLRRDLGDIERWARARSEHGRRG